MRNDNDDDYAVYEDTEEVAAPAASSVAPAPPSDEQILAFVQANIDNPALIAETAAQYGVSVADLSRATGFGSDAVVSYFEQHDVAPPAYTPPPIEVERPEPPPPPPPPPIVEPPPPPEEPIYDPPPPPPPPPEPPVVEPPRPPVVVEPPPPPPTPVVVTPPPIEEKPIVEPPPKDIIGSPPPVVEASKPPTTTTTTLTDYQGNQFNGDQVLKLAQQISQNAGTMTGGAFQTKGQSIGFDASEANKLLGRTATASEQVLLDMARQMIQSGVTDLSQLKTQDITGSASVSIDPDTGQYYALVPSGDGETSTRKDLTADQVAKIRTEEVIGDDGGMSTRKTINDLVTGKGLFANGKMLSQADALNNPIEYTIGNTYTGGGGTSYQLKIDPKTGKPVVSASGFTTSDADTIMPIIAIASNFLLPGVGSMLASTLAEAGMSEIVSQVVSKAVLNGVTSGIMAEVSGGDFGDGFLKGAVTGAIAAGVSPMISTALPSDLSPTVSTALTKAGTAAVTALATGQDVTKAVSTQLFNAVTSGGIGSLSDEMGLSAADAKLLTSVLSPVVTQLVTNGTVNSATIMNAVLLAGSTVLANTDSSGVINVTNLTTGDDDGDGTTDTSGTGGLNVLARDAGNVVGTSLAATSTATGLLNKATSLTKPVTKVNKTKANLVGALRTNKPTVAAAKPSALSTLNQAKTAAVKPAALSTLNAAKTPTKVNVANLTPIKTTSPPKKVDVSTLKPLTNVSGLTTLKPTPTGKG